MADVVVKVVPAHESALHELIAKLDREMLEKYPQEGVFGVDFSDTKVDEMIFAVAFVGDIPAGCGGIRPLDANSVELKRFFVDSAFRQKGIASKLLTFLEKEAKHRGYGSVKLETGPLQPESIALYRKFGYDEIGLFGEYTDSRYSICFEKML